MVFLSIKAAIPRLPNDDTLTEEEDNRFVSYLQCSENVFEHELVLKPLAWLEPFGITDPKTIQAVRERVIKSVYEEEAKYRRNRTRPVMGVQHLRRQPYFKPHKPAKRERKIFVICSDTELRQRIISFVRQIAEKCRRCYEDLKQGLPVVWPDGVFIPWLPPRGFSSFSREVLFRT